MTKTRVAVMGTSWWADNAHLPGLRSRAEADVVALCGRDPARAAALAAKYGIPGVFTDPEKMLAQAQPEVVVVSVPNYLHAPFTLAALEAGAHVICEKPLALTAFEATQMLERAEALGRKHLTFFTYRGMGGPRHLKHLVSEGYLGQLHHVQACYLHNTWLNPERLGSWKTNKAQSGSGVLGDLGAHVIDLLQWWCGPLTRATGSLQTFIHERPRPDGTRGPVETDDACAFVAEFAQSGQATVQLSRVAPERHNYMRFELYGEQGMLVYEYDETLAHLGRVSGARRGAGDPRAIPLPEHLTSTLAGRDSFPAVYRALTDSFFASLRDPSITVSPSFTDGLAAQKVIDAVARSAASGSWEKV